MKEEDEPSHGFLIIILILLVLVVLMLELPAPYSLIVYDITILPIIALPFLEGTGVIYSLFLGRKSKDWPRTMGTITHSTLVKKDISNGEFTEQYWCLEIEYKYTYNGSTYSSTRFFAGGDGEYRNEDLKEAQHILSKYEKNRVVDVYFNPKHHSYGILRTGLSATCPDSEIMGIGYIGVGLYLFFTFFIFFDFNGMPHLLLFERL